MLSTIRLGLVEEEIEIHKEVQRIFNKEKISYEYEKVLGKGSRVDFLVGGNIALEVKKGKPNKQALMNQLRRYASFEEVEYIILLSERFIRVGDNILGKPCEVVVLRSLWF